MTETMIARVGRQGLTRGHTVAVFMKVVVTEGIPGMVAFAINTMAATILLWLYGVFGEVHTSSSID
jgi:hypothetical protein